MTNNRFTVLSPEDYDVPVRPPAELHRLVTQGLVDLSPWHLMPRALAKTRMASLRERYRTKYIPFAMRQDCDDLACLDPGAPDRVVVVHDRASEGSERRATYDAFWSWFRAAIDDMIVFEP